jgi:hypothetical protein
MIVMLSATTLGTSCAVSPRSYGAVDASGLQAGVPAGAHAGRYPGPTRSEKSPDIELANCGPPEYTAVIACTPVVAWVVEQVARPASSGWAAHPGTGTPPSWNATEPVGFPRPLRAADTSAV